MDKEDPAGRGICLGCFDKAFWNTRDNIKRPGWRTAIGEEFVEMEAGLRDERWVDEGGC
jgi:hypothetical protein